MTEEARSLCWREEWGVLGRERGLRIQGKVRKGLLTEPVTQERAAE